MPRTPPGNETMKAAFSIWENRIAPVFDAAAQIRLVEIESGNIVHYDREILPDVLPVQKALRLAEINAEILICGAISKSMFDLIISYGIRVIPFIAGTVDEVVHHWASGLVDWTCFTMPGCSGFSGRWSAGHYAMTPEGGSEIE